MTQYELGSQPIHQSCQKKGPFHPLCIFCFKLNGGFSCGSKQFSRGQSPFMAHQWIVLWIGLLTCHQWPNQCCIQKSTHASMVLQVFIIIQKRQIFCHPSVFLRSLRLWKYCINIIKIEHTKHIGQSNQLLWPDVMMGGQSQVNSCIRPSFSYNFCKFQSNFGQHSSAA